MSSIRAVVVASVVAGSAGVAAAHEAYVRAVHASPDAPNVDVLVNDVRAIQNLAFTRASSYLTVADGATNFKVVPAGQDNPVVINADVVLEDEKTYSVAAINRLSSIEALVLEDDNTIDAGNARVRFVHASPNAPAVDIALAGGDVLFPDYTFREASSYLTLPEGTFDLEVRLAGTNTVVLSIPGVGLTRGTVVTAWAMGLVGDTQSPLQAVFTVDAIPAPGAAVVLGMAGLVATRRRR